MPPPPAVHPSSTARRSLHSSWIHPHGTNSNARHQDGHERHEQHYYTERHEPMNRSSDSASRSDHNSYQHDSFHERPRHGPEIPYPSETVHQMTFYRRSIHRPYTPELPPPPPPRPMWKATLDSKSGKVYYYHRQTREVSWKRPDAPVEDLPSSSVPRRRSQARPHASEPGTLSQQQAYARSQAKAAAAVAAEHRALKTAAVQEKRAREALERARRGALARRALEPARTRATELHRPKDAPKSGPSSNNKRVLESNKHVKESQPAKKAQKLTNSTSSLTSEGRGMNESRDGKKTIAMKIADLQKKRNVIAKQDSDQLTAEGEQISKPNQHSVDANKPESVGNGTVGTAQPAGRAPSKQQLHTYLPRTQETSDRQRDFAPSSIQKRLYSTSRLASNLKLARLEDGQKSVAGQVSASRSRALEPEIVDLTTTESSENPQHSVTVDEAQRAWEDEHLIHAAIRRSSPSPISTTKGATSLDSSKCTENPILRKSMQSIDDKKPKSKPASKGRSRSQNQQNDFDAAKKVQRKKPPTLEIHIPSTQKDEHVESRAPSKVSDDKTQKDNARYKSKDETTSEADSELAHNESLEDTSETDVPFLQRKGLLESLQAADPYFLLHESKGSDKRQVVDAPTAPQKRRRAIRQLPMVRPKLLPQSSARKAAVRSFQLRQGSTTLTASNDSKSNAPATSVQASNKPSRKSSSSTQGSAAMSKEVEAPRRRSRAAAERAKAALACYTVATSSESENEFEDEKMEVEKKPKAVSRKKILSKERQVDEPSTEESEFNDQLISRLKKDGTSDLDSDNNGLQGLVDLLCRGGDFKVSQVVRQTTSMIEDAIRLFPWTWPQSEDGHADLVSNAFQHFSRDVIAPTMRAHNAKKVTNAVPVVFGTLLLLREVMMQNAEAIFGSSILPPQEDTRGSERKKQFMEQATLFSIKTLVTSVILFALDKFGHGILSDRFLNVVDSYDSGSEEFSSLMEQLQDARVVVLPGGRLMDEEESEMWQASFK